MFKTIFSKKVDSRPPEDLSLLQEASFIAPIEQELNNLFEQCLQQFELNQTKASPDSHYLFTLNAVLLQLSALPKHQQEAIVSSALQFFSHIHKKTPYTPLEFSVYYTLVKGLLNPRVSSSAKSLFRKLMQLVHHKGLKADSETSDSLDISLDTLDLIEKLNDNDLSQVKEIFLFIVNERGLLDTPLSKQYKTQFFDDLCKVTHLLFYTPDAYTLDYATKTHLFSNLSPESAFVLIGQQTIPLSLPYNSTAKFFSLLTPLGQELFQLLKDDLPENNIESVYFQPYIESVQKAF